MAMLWSIRQYENLEKGKFEGVGKYDIPPLSPVTLEEPVNMIGFNCAKKCKQPVVLGVHFFLKDYQFSRLWNSPDRYTEMLARFRFVCTPDFSMYTDYPRALQINSHYRKHWLGAYWQSRGLTVVPTICWSDARSFEWCFDGEPQGSTVTLSSVGTQNNRDAKRLFLLGFERMLQCLHPSTVLFHGQAPPDAERMAAEGGAKLVRVAAYQERLRGIETGAV